MLSFLQLKLFGPTYSVFELIVTDDGQTCLKNVAVKPLITSFFEIK